jgi:hypothetical protein
MCPAHRTDDSDFAGEMPRSRVKRLAKKLFADVPRCDGVSPPQWVAHDIAVTESPSFDRLARKPSYLISIHLMPTRKRPSTIFLTDFGCNEIVFFSGVSLVTFFAPAKKVTRPLASESPIHKR